MINKRIHRPACESHFITDKFGYFRTLIIK